MRRANTPQLLAKMRMITLITYPNKNAVITKLTVMSLLYALSISTFENGRAGGTRTPNRSIWSRLLYQLSYYPTYVLHKTRSASLVGRRSHSDVPWVRLRSIDSLPPRISLFLKHSDVDSFFILHS